MTLFIVPKELQYPEFDERLLPIFDYVAQEVGQEYDPHEFIGSWRHYMALGVARAWESESSVLGAFFTKDLYSNKLRAQVAFFFALPEVRGTAVTKNLFLAFEQAAKEAGCVDIQVAAHEGSEPERRADTYLKNGFRKTETVYTKTL